MRPEHLRRARPSHDHGAELADRHADEEPLQARAEEANEAQHLPAPSPPGRAPHCQRRRSYRAGHQARLIFPEP